MSKSSPRTWGCFWPAPAWSLPVSVFPTHVGVFPTDLAPMCARRSLPHARGGVSPYRGMSLLEMASSPRTWGCFFEPRDDHQR